MNWPDVAGAVALTLYSSICVAFGFLAGRRSAARRRRAAMGLPPSAARGPGILALVPSLDTLCPGCGKKWRRHPARAEKRCDRCVAEAFDAQEQAEIDALREQGWRR